MTSLFLLLGAFLHSAVVGYVTYRYDIYRKEQVPDEISIFEWLSRSHHWHSWGHYFIDFLMTMFTGSLVWAIFPGWVDANMILAACLSMIPATLLTLYTELINDGHWKSFVGKESKDDTIDFIFDLYTHLSGGVAGILFLLASMVH